MIELRCGKRLHGYLDEDGRLEVACRSALCGHVDGTVVIHVFDLKTGDLMDTRFYKDATTNMRRSQGDALGYRTTVRRT